MSNHQFYRIQQINEQLNLFSNGRVPIEKLMEVCGRKKRTIKEDIQYMRDEYGAPIKYDRIEKGYYYAEPFNAKVMISLSKKDLAALEVAVNNLNQYRNPSIFKDLEGLFDKVSKAVRFRGLKKREEGSYIQMESVPYFKGDMHIPFFLDTIRKKQVVAFTYHKFNGEIKEMQVEPYLLKEHRNRWYVIGRDKYSNIIKSFGLDRIEENPAPGLIEDYFNPVSPAYIQHLFNQSFGLYINESQKPEKVILSFNKARASYFKTQPFLPYNQNEHVIQDDDEAFIIQREIQISDELVMEIARQGEGLKVIAPESLKEKVKDYLKRALEQY